MIDALAPSHTVVVKAPPKHGKTSLLFQYITRARAEKRRVVFVDFSIFSGAELEKYEAFLSSLALILAKRLGSKEIPAKGTLTQADLEDFVSRMLDETSAPISFVLDAVDRLMRRGYQNDFFGMLRGFHNNRTNPARPEWEKFDLALAISMEPYLLVKNVEQSPFNVGQVISLSPFTLEEAVGLNQHYDNFLQDSDVKLLWEQLGGHPYLTQLAYYEILKTSNPLPFDQLLSRAAEPDGPFGDHLRALLATIANDEDLVSATIQLLKSRPIDDATAARLRGAGLLRETDGVRHPANLLYAQFLRRVLGLKPKK